MADKTLMLPKRGLTVRYIGDTPIAAIGRADRAYKLRSDKPQVLAAQAVWLGRAFDGATIVSAKRMTQLVEGD